MSEGLWCFGVNVFLVQIIPVDYCSWKKTILPLQGIRCSNLVAIVVQSGLPMCDVACHMVFESSRFNLSFVANL